MKFAVMGAGAVGCYFGGMLARAGHPVVLIGRPVHVQAIERDGLRMQTRSFDERVRIAASTESAAAAGADVVLFCVKSPDTAAAGTELKRHLAPGAVVLSLQNGVDNAERLRTVLPQTVAAAVVYVATEMAGPGHLRHHGRGELVLEPFAGDGPVREALAGAGVPVERSANVRGALWAKLILNCAYNALSAIVQQPYGVLAAAPGVQAVMRDVVDECLALARAEGVTLPDDVDGAVRRIAETMPAQFSSTAQDLARGKPSEIDHLNGFIVERSAAHGLQAPANRVLHTLVRLIEAKAAAGSTT